MKMQKQDWLVLIVAIVAIAALVQLGPYATRSDVAQNTQCEAVRKPAGYKGGAFTDLNSDCR